MVLSQKTQFTSFYESKDEDGRLISMTNDVAKHFECIALEKFSDCNKLFPLDGSGVQVFLP